VGRGTDSTAGPPPRLPWPTLGPFALPLTVSMAGAAEELGHTFLAACGGAEPGARLVEALFLHDDAAPRPLQADLLHQQIGGGTGALGGMRASLHGAQIP